MNGQLRPSCDDTVTYVINESSLRIKLIILDYYLTTTTTTWTTKTTKTTRTSVHLINRSPSLSPPGKCSVLNIRANLRMHIVASECRSAHMRCMQTRLYGWVGPVGRSIYRMVLANNADVAPPSRHTLITRANDVLPNRASSCLSLQLLINTALISESVASLAIIPSTGCLFCARRFPENFL